MLSNEQIADFARAWYRKLDVHAPTQELVDMLNPSGLKMVFPESSFFRDPDNIQLEFTAPYSES
jgi:hypothetical protein